MNRLAKRARAPEMAMLFIRAVLLSLCLAAAPALAASTAAPVTPGYLTNTLQPNCAQTPCFVPYGAAGQVVTSAPYQYTPIASSGQYNQPATSSTALTVPTAAIYGMICAVGGQMNYTTSGAAPTTGVAPTSGAVLASGACYPATGQAVMAAFRIINAVASTGTWTAEYFQ